MGDVTLHEAALNYAARSWRVIPLWWPVQTAPAPRCACPRGATCGKNTGKHPNLEDWGQQATTDTNTITHWWRRWPRANVGLVAGPASGLAIVDVDPRNGGDGSLEELQRLYQPFPDTPQVLSGGGGQHYYFATAVDLPCIDLAPGVNFLADTSHQAVAPPSLHPSGTRYAWELSSHPDDVPLAPLPAWIVALVQDAVTERTAYAATLPADLPVVAFQTLKVSAAIMTLIRTGGHPAKRYPSRSEAVFAVIAALVRGGYDDATIAAVLLDPGNGISDKPLTQKNPRSPLYWELTRGWVAREIARCRTKATPQPQVAPAGVRRAVGHRILPRLTPRLTRRLA